MVHLFSLRRQILFPIRTIHTVYNRLDTQLCVDVTVDRGLKYTISSSTKYSYDYYGQLLSSCVAMVERSCYVESLLCLLCR
jgi:hypothetical protein